MSDIKRQQIVVIKWLYLQDECMNNDSPPPERL